MMWSVRFGGSVEIDYKDGIRRKAITENQVIIVDSNISLDNIYKAIGYLTPEHMIYSPIMKATRNILKTYFMYPMNT